MDRHFGAKSELFDAKKELFVIKLKLLIFVNNLCEVAKFSVWENICSFCHPPQASSFANKLRHLRKILMTRLLRLRCKVTIRTKLIFQIRTFSHQIIPFWHRIGNNFFRGPTKWKKLIFTKNLSSRLCPKVDSDYPRGTCENVVYHFHGTMQTIITCSLRPVKGLNLLH